MNEWYVEFEEDYDYPDNPDVMEIHLMTDDDAPDSVFSFLVYADTREEAIEKAIQEYHDMVEIETSFPDVVDDYDY